MICYLSYGFLDAQVPTWVRALRALDETIVWADNLTSLSSIAKECGERFVLSLQAAELQAPYAVASANASALRIPADVFRPVQEMLPRLVATEATPTLDAVTKALYLLVRARVVVVDLDLPGYGERGFEACLANQLRIPILGVTTRFTADPWLLHVCRAVTQPEPTTLLQLARSFGGDSKFNGSGRGGGVIGRPQSGSKSLQQGGEAALKDEAGSHQ